MNRNYFLLLLFVLGIFSGSLVSRNQHLVEVLDQSRRRIFLFPNEIEELHHTLKLTNKVLLKEKQFKELLVKQSQSEEPYIVVSLTDNRLYLKQKDKILRNCLVATGKQEKVQYGKHTYHFFTPREVFTIWKKTEKPLWVMPDWGYHELGQKPPPMPERKGIPEVLGDYALYLQNGYMIHGTIGETDLGKYITHGCVRMGKQDLKAIYDYVRSGRRCMCINGCLDTFAAGKHSTSVQSAFRVST